MARSRIAIVDDEPVIRMAIRKFLTDRGYEVSEASSCAEARELLQQARPDALLVDYFLPDGTALDLLAWTKSREISAPAIILTAHGSIELAVEAIKEGAEHFLVKPIELPAMLVILQRSLENQRTRRQQVAGKSRMARETPDPFLGTSSVIRELAQQASKVVEADFPVLLQGETGTGKGLLAGWLHRHGARSDEAFVELNCAGLSRDFLETELFGHEVGAFTGAVKAKMGLVEVADKGTAFLDEIGDMDPQVQPKVLKVLEEGKFRRLGETRERQVDVRLVAATHHDILQLVRENKFREDLYFRISTVPLRVPSLRERVEDIPFLIENLLGRIRTELGRSDLHIHADAIVVLQEYGWPGNIRELRNVLERAALLSKRDLIAADDLQFGPPLHDVSSPTTASSSFLELERDLLEKAIREAGGVEQAAHKLGIPRSTLYYKIKKYRIAPSKS